jgi:hypothetical protein
MPNDELNIVDQIVDDTVTNPIPDETLAQTDEVIPAPVDAPVEIPAEPEPVVNDVAPEMGDETPMDGCPCDNCVCDNIGCFFGTLQESITITWRYHLKTRKHHVHVALNEFYDKAIDIIDDIIEQYQGINGVVEDPFTNCLCADGKTENEYLLDLKNFVETNKSLLGEHSEINSTIDEFFALIDSTIYKIVSFNEHVVKSFEEFVYEDYVSESCCGEEEDDDEEEE